MNDRDDETARPNRTGALRQPWLLASALGLLAAAAFWFAGWAEAAFVTAALGVVAWFLNVRATLPKSADAPREDEFESDAADDEFEDDDSEDESAAVDNVEIEEAGEDGERRPDGSPRAGG